MELPFPSPLGLEAAHNVIWIHWKTLYLWVQVAGILSVWSWRVVWCVNNVGSSVNVVRQGCLVSGPSLRAKLHEILGVSWLPLQTYNWLRVIDIISTFMFIRAVPCSPRSRPSAHFEPLGSASDLPGIIPSSQILPLRKSIIVHM